MTALSRLSGTLLIISFVTLTLCGAGLLTLHARELSHVAGCPFAGTMSPACPLSAIHQLVNFSSVLGTLSVNSLLAALLGLMLVFIVQTGTVTPPRINRLSRLHEGGDSGIWRPLQYAFSRGILNPKIH